MQAESLARSLEQHPFITGMGPAELEFLAGCSKNARYAAGEYLFRENGPADTLFLLRSGHVALESAAAGRGTTRLETLGSADVLGWSALFEPFRWHLDGIALEPTLVFAIDGKCLRPKLEREPSFGYQLTRRLLYQVHRRLERARLQQLDVYRAEPR